MGTTQILILLAAGLLTSAAGLTLVGVAFELIDRRSPVGACGFESLLPLRGRWLDYAISAVLLLLGLAFILFPLLALIVFGARLVAH